MVDQLTINALSDNGLHGHRHAVPVVFVAYGYHPKANSSCVFEFNCFNNRARSL